MNNKLARRVEGCGSMRCNFTIFTTLAGKVPAGVCGVSPTSLANLELYYFTTYIIIIIVLVKIIEDNSEDEKIFTNPRATRKDSKVVKIIPFKPPHLVDSFGPPGTLLPQSSKVPTPVQDDLQKGEP